MGKVYAGKLKILKRIEVTKEPHVPEDLDVHLPSDGVEVIPTPEKQPEDNVVVEDEPESTLPDEDTPEKQVPQGDVDSEKEQVKRPKKQYVVRRRVRLYGRIVR